MSEKTKSARPEMDVNQAAHDVIELLAERGATIGNVRSVLRYVDDYLSLMPVVPLGQRGESNSCASTT